MNTTMQPPRFEELNVLDDFMFNELTMQADEEKSILFCKILLETILGTPVRSLKIIPQKTVQGFSDGHGIRIDAFVEAFRLDDQTEVTDVQMQPDIFDLEPNCYKERFLEKRTRFYHSLIDSKILRRGKKYNTLKNVFLIIILPYDPFGLDRMLYTIKRGCVEEPALPYEDGSVTLILNTRGKKDIPSQALQSMLQYLEKSSEQNATNDDLRTIHRMLEDIRRNDEIGVKYMQAWDREMHFREEGYRDGVEDGKEIGQDSFAALVSWLLGENRLADVWAATEDPARRKELFGEYEQMQNSMSAKMTK